VAIYLARFRRRFLVVDAGDPRATRIPESHNIPFFGEGIPGPEILHRGRAAAERHGAWLLERVTDQVEQHCRLAEHEGHEGDEVQPGHRLGQALVVAGETAEAGSPGERALDMR
jgi:thioredoxin reductase